MIFDSPLNLTPFGLLHRNLPWAFQKPRENSTYITYIVNLEKAKLPTLIGVRLVHKDRILASLFNHNKFVLQERLYFSAEHSRWTHARYDKLPTKSLAQFRCHILCYRESTFVALGTFIKQVYARFCRAFLFLRTYSFEQIV